MKPRLRLLVVLFMFVLWLAPAHAQTDSAPLILGVREDREFGQLYALEADGTLRQLTDQPYVLMDRMNALISPNGRYLVYSAVSEFFMLALENNEVGNFGDYVTDLYLLDLETGESRLIAGQSDGADYNVRGSYVFHTLLGGRSASWSPDGNEIAYSKLRHDCSIATDFCTQVLIYNAAESSSRVLVQSLDPLGSPSLWTDEGILLGTGSSGYRIYAPDGTLRSLIYDNQGFVPSYTMEYDGRPYVIGGVLGFPNTEDDLWYLLDVQTGEYFRVDGYASVMSASVDDPELILFDYDNDTRPRAVYNREQQLIARPPEGPPFGVDYIPSPNGQQYAYHLTENAGGVIGFADGEEMPLPVAGDPVAWGTPRYTIFTPEGEIILQPTNDAHNSRFCGTLEPVGLVAGGQGRVLPGDPNRIRSAPRIDAEMIGNIPGGATFDVVVGQQNVCSNGIRWAQVIYEGIQGWTAEGSDGVAFLEPLG